MSCPAETSTCRTASSRAEDEFPLGHVERLRTPRGQHDVYRLLVRLARGTAEILFDRSSRSRTAGETVMHWLFPLHSGTAFGQVGKIAMCLTGLAPLLLVLTGLWVWARKRRAERIELARRQELLLNAGNGGCSRVDGSLQRLFSRRNLCLPLQSLAPAPETAVLRSPSRFDSQTGREKCTCSKRRRGY
jgi:hypothetical protein